jgi:2-C-methyl-D-erythritol 4-phosphate cytidylyltransferase
VEAWAVIVAAGTGTRFGAPKQFCDLDGRPIVEWSLVTARQVCAGVVLVLPADAPRRSWPADTVVTGGATRAQSVRAGLSAVPTTAAVIAVHDAARPLARRDLWRAVLDAVEAGADGAIPATAVTDTVKEVDSDGHLVTLDRSRLVAVQTPQAFRADVLRRAHSSDVDATDDAALVEAAGGRIVLVDGATDNLKVTTPSDLIAAAALAAAQTS